MPVPFNISRTKHVIPLLSRSWPSFDPAVSDEALWTEHVKKYGSCSLCRLDALNDTTAYVELAFGFYFRAFDLNRYFERADIRPDLNKPVAFDRFDKSLAFANFSGKMDFHCEGQINNLDVLQEVSLCVNVSSFMINPCGPVRDSTCKTAQVYYLGNLGRGGP